MKILVFLPTYNEKENIAEIIDSLNKLNIQFQILIVDDNSYDGTIEIIKEKQKQYQNLKLIIRKGRKGRGLAGILAFNYFIRNKYDILIEMDADFSHHPKYIPDFLNFFPNYDLVIGSRLIKDGCEEGRSLLRRDITLFANIFIRILFRTKIKDCSSGFRAFKRQLLEKFNLNKFFSKHYSITEEILYACILNKAKIKEIPIIFYQRAYGESKLNFKKILNTFLGIVRIVLRGKKIIKK